MTDLTDLTDLKAQFGDIDIYLFDQLLRGCVTAGMRILDAGCGAGRNLVYLLRQGFEVFAADSDPHALTQPAASPQPSPPLSRPKIFAGNRRGDVLSGALRRLRHQ